jgi:hypothetical protein
MPNVLPTGFLAVWGGANWGYPWSFAGCADRLGASASPAGRPPPPRNGTGVASLALGLVALVLAVSFVPLGRRHGIFALLLGLLALLLGLVALVLGTVGVRRARRHDATNKGPAVAGLTAGA